ncbi:cellulose synthase [Sesbania bispinosa]|nr:cellulose synthase [Sesbania bispinosa]
MARCYDGGCRQRQRDNAIETRCCGACCEWRRRDETMRLGRCSSLWCTNEEDEDTAACCSAQRRRQRPHDALWCSMVSRKRRTTWIAMVLEGGGARRWCAMEFNGGTRKNGGAVF